MKKLEKKAKSGFAKVKDDFSKFNDSLIKKFAEQAHIPNDKNK